MCFAIWGGADKNERRLFPEIIGIGIVLVSILSSVLPFDHLCIYDFAIDGLLIYFVFFKRINREIL